MKPLREFLSGIATGLVLQVAVGPVFVFIINLSLQHGMGHGLASAAAVALVDGLYIALALLGVAALLERETIRRFFGILSIIVLAGIGIMMIRSGFRSPGTVETAAVLGSPAWSFLHVFLLTITNPLTIVTYTSVFGARASAYQRVGIAMALFGAGTATATFLFMVASVLVVSLVKTAIPSLMMQLLNVLVGSILICYAARRYMEITRRSTHTRSA